MKPEYLCGIVGVVIGILVMVGYNATQPQANQDMDHMSEAMDEMNHNVSSANGADFDKVFIEEMIVHHKGAIDMANEALAKSQHQEIKDMAKDIITAQTREIEQMNSWHKEWFGN